MTNTGPQSTPDSVLILDDAPAVRSSIRQMLTNFGVPEDGIREADQAREGLEIFREENPDLVLLDIVLEGIQGDDIGEIMLAEDPDTTMALVTALSRDDQRVRFLVSKGARDVIQKPVSPDAVRSLVDAHDSVSNETEAVA